MWRIYVIWFKIIWRKYRNEKGLSQQNLADLIHKNRTTISRFENGELLPNAEKIKIICDELGIYELDLFNREYAFSNKKNVNNPFETDTLYMYFNAYNSNTKRFNKDELLEKLKPSENELQNLKKNFALYLEIFKK